jgi:hypothetical protein
MNSQQKQAEMRLNLNVVKLFIQRLITEDTTPLINSEKHGIPGEQIPQGLDTPTAPFAADGLLKVNLPFIFIPNVDGRLSWATAVLDFPSQQCPFQNLAVPSSMRSALPRRSART